MHLRTILIPAAGLGTRLLPATKAVPKELLAVYDRPVLQFAIDEAIAAGAERVVVVIHPDKLAIRDYLQPDDALVHSLNADGKAELGTRLAAVQVPATMELVFAFQNHPLGLGHAISCGVGLVLPGPVGVILPDDVILGTPCIAEMADAYRGGHMVAAMTVPATEAQNYGMFRLLGATGGRCIAVSSMVEKPEPGTEPSLLAAVGRYILDPSIFSTLKATRRGVGAEIQLTDAITQDASRLALTAFRFSGQRYDCGSHDGLLAAAQARQLQVKQHRNGHAAPWGAAGLTARLNRFDAAIAAQ